jgi:heme/copper-type cytochrome/quinol oxidase subunit 2
MHIIYILVYMWYNTHRNNIKGCLKYHLENRVELEGMLAVCPTVYIYIIYIYQYKDGITVCISYIY